MAVSSTTGGLRTGVCLSTDRPQNPYNGQVVYETDTNRTLVWDNSAWVVVADPALVSFSGTGATVTAAAVTIGGENVNPYTGRRNLLYNGAMQVAQRGTSTTGITSSGYYTADRFRLSLGSQGTWTHTIENDGPDGYPKSFKMLCSTADSAPASGDFVGFQQYLEGYDVQYIKKGTSSANQLTLSFWVKSNVTGTYIAELRDDDNNRQVSKSYTINASATWEQKLLTFPADTTGVFNNDNSNSLSLILWQGAGSTYSSGTLNTSWAPVVNANRAAGQVNLASAVNNYWQITGVQLEVGDKATPFEHRSFGEELALCQRYFEKSSPYGDAVGNSMGTSDYVGSGTYSDGWRAEVNVPFKVSKRTTPSIGLYGPSGATSGWYVYNISLFPYNAVGTYAVAVNENNFKLRMSTWNGSSGTLNFTNHASYLGRGAWTASAEL